MSDGSTGDRLPLAEGNLITNIRHFLPAVFLLAGLLLTRWHSFLLFHSLTEGVSIATAFGVFMIAWHSRKFLANGYLALIGVAYLFMAVLDLLHVLSYPGAGVIAVHDLNVPTQLWVAARLVQGSAILLAPLAINRVFRYNATLGAYAAITAAMIVGIFGGFFPDCWREETGLTLFKAVSEYAIVLLVSAGGWLLWKRRRFFDREVLRWLLVSILCTALSEAAFSGHFSGYEPLTVGGHLLKLLAFFFLYRAVIETGLVTPFRILFQELKHGEEELRREYRLLVDLQRELAAKNQELAKINARKNEFVGMVAHDLRSPLSVIMWYSEILRESGRLAPEQENIAGRIHVSSEYMLRLVDDLLDLTSIEAGTITLKPREIDLVELAGRVAGMLGVFAQAKEIRLEARPLVGSLVLRADPQRLEQALANLVTNAIKYSPKGGRIEVVARREGAEGLLEVRDQGPGIPASEQGKLFRAFERTSVQTTAGEKSTGLGLAIVKKIAVAHGGRVELSSAEGQGSVFTIRLPLDGGTPPAAEHP